MNDFLLTRRDFLRHASFGALAWRAFVPRAAAPVVLRIGIIKGADRDRMDGALLGAEEARRAAALFAGECELVNIDESEASSYPAVIGDGNAERCTRLARVTLTMNVVCTGDMLRAERCAPMLFHVVPSDAMVADTSRAVGTTDHIEAWDYSLRRFGADTLNQRFQSRFGRHMTTEAWTAWVAVKILWESALRTKSADRGVLADFLVRPTTQFDGHKGRPLSFRPWDRQLRQPVYARRGNLVIEFPVERGDESASAGLDRIGIGESQSLCRSTP